MPCWISLSDGGGNFLDTANNYAIWNGEGGESETMLGSWFADRGNRDQIVLATKMGGRAKDAPMSSKPEHIRRQCERSLKRLQTGVACRNCQVALYVR